MEKQLKEFRKKRPNQVPVISVHHEPLNFLAADELYSDSYALNQRSKGHRAPQHYCPLLSLIYCLLPQNHFSSTCTHAQTPHTKWTGGPRCNRVVITHSCNLDIPLVSDVDPLMFEGSRAYGPVNGSSLRLRNH